MNCTPRLCALLVICLLSPGVFAKKSLEKHQEIYAKHKKTCQYWTDVYRKEGGNTAKWHKKESCAAAKKYRKEQLTPAIDKAEKLEIQASQITGHCEQIKLQLDMVNSYLQSPKSADQREALRQQQIHLAQIVEHQC